jgi:hypothetical protein
MNRAPLIATILLAASLAACVEEPRGHKIAAQPKDIQPTRLGVWATLPEDTDGNGYLDTVDVTVYLSSDSYAAPIAVPGEFEFHLVGKGGKEFAKWIIPEEKAIKCARRMPAGPAYFFRLSMLEVGTDQVDAHDASLTAEFRPKSGNPVRAPKTALPFGKVRA